MANVEFIIERCTWEQVEKYLTARRKDYPDVDNLGHWRGLPEHEDVKPLNVLNERMLVAGKTVGIATYNSCGQLYLLWVHPKYRHLKIATRYLKSLPIHHTSVKAGNKVLIDWYLRQGFFVKREADGWVDIERCKHGVSTSTASPTDHEPIRKTRTRSKNPE